MDFTKLSDREILIELRKHRDIAERCANELLRRVSEEPTHD